MTLLVPRRAALLGLSAAVTFGRASLAVAQAPTDQRFVVVLLRGALDGLSAVVPYGDPDLMKLRGEIVPPGPGKPGGVLDLGGFYGLHPSLPGLQGLYAAGDLLPIHAVAGHYRSRSHFEAQDYMESGADERLSSGWLYRTLAAMPDTHQMKQPAVAISVTVPLLLRGPGDVGTWAPPAFSELDPDLYQRLEALTKRDPVIGPAIATALATRGFDAQMLSGNPDDVATSTQDMTGFAFLAANAGRLMRAADGPRLAAMEVEGWDTHSEQPGRLVQPLMELDAGLVAMKMALGDVWRRTVVLVITEFGRTVRANGTLGTDHGTAGVAFVAGGNVAGGKVRADWPTLAPGKLFEDRDLQPTADVRSVAKGLLAAHLGIPTPALETVFPGSAAAAPMTGLLRV